MCCRTNSFCCTHDLRKGIMIAGIVDIILLLILIALNIGLQFGFASLWFLVIIIADILLVIGANGNISGLMMVWMIIGMINIVFLFIGWIALPVWGAVAIFATAACNDNGFTSAGGDCGGAETAILIGFALNAIFIIGLPIYYIYLWIVVKSHRENLTQAERNTIQPMQGNQ